VVGGVKTAALDNQAGAGTDQASHIPPAFRAGLQWFVGHALAFFKAMSATFTFIFVGWHIIDPFSKH
jgi:hypothetical protein